MLICVMGKNRSGKSTVAKEFAKQASLPIVEVSDLVKKISRQASREALQKEKENHTNDPSWLYREIKKEIDSYKSIGVIVSGIREKNILEWLEKDYKKIYTVGASISDEERKRRTINLDRKTEEDFKNDEERDKTYFPNLNEMIATAKVLIPTDRSLDEMTSHVKLALEEFGLQI